MLCWASVEAQVLYTVLFFIKEIRIPKKIVAERQSDLSISHEKKYVKV